MNTHATMKVLFKYIYVYLLSIYMGYYQIYINRYY